MPDRPPPLEPTPDSEPGKPAPGPTATAGAKTATGMPSVAPKAGPPTRATWGPWMALGGAVLALVIGLILALPVIAADGGDTDSLGTTARALVQLFTAAGFLIGPFLVASQAGGGLGAAAGRLGLVSFRPGSAAKWIGIALVGYIAFAIGWAAIFGEPEQKDIAGELGPLWTQVLLIAIIAPISEEICFRGLLFGGFRRRFTFPVAAIGAGLVFGLLHYSTGWSTVPQLAVLGAAFALVYERTGSLWPPIIFHAVNNAFVLATLN